MPTRPIYVDEVQRNPSPSKGCRHRSAPSGTPAINAFAESVFGLFKNEAIAVGSPFRTGPPRILADVEAITTGYVDWYNNARLHSLLGNVTPEEFEHAYYTHETGSPTGAAANDKTA